MKKHSLFYRFVFIIVLGGALICLACHNGLFAYDDSSLPEEEYSGEDTQGIKEYLERALPTNENRRIVLDETTGMLTVTDTPGNQKIVKELIKLWDVGSQQVRIEARFVEVAITSIGELGVDWYWYKAQNSFKSNDVQVNALTPPLDTSLTADDTVRAFPQAADTSGLGLMVGKSFLSGSQLWVYIKALEEEDKANLLSSPSVTTLSGQAANIQLARIFPYATDVTRTNIGTAANPDFVEQYKVTEKVTGINLEVTPRVAGDGRIINMDIHPEVTVLVEQIPITNVADFPDDLGYPVIDTRVTQTSVVVRSGQTVILGGLVREDETVTERKTPFLGDIPIFGNLFKSKHVNKAKKNLVIFLTATIIDSKGEPVI